MQVKQTKRHRPGSKRQAEIASFAHAYGISLENATALFAKYSTKPDGYRPLVEIDSNAKVAKGKTNGYMSGILHLAPANQSGRQVCGWASDECISLCLDHSGRAEVFSSIVNARIAKARYYFENRSGFKASLLHDAFRLLRKAAKHGYKPCLRPNGTSDLVDLGHTVATTFPMLQVYDYTKRPRPELYTLPNYHLSFSFSGRNKGECAHALANGTNVVVVFQGIRKGQSLPQTHMGVPVIDGDVTDLRFLDPKGVVVGLRVKGTSQRKAKSNCFFVQPETNTNPLIQIAA